MHLREILVALRERCAPARDAHIDRLITVVDEPNQLATTEELAQLVVNTSRAILELTEVMKEDLHLFADLNSGRDRDRQYGVDGVVLGVLTVSGEIDVEKAKMLVDEAVGRGLEGRLDFVDPAVHLKGRSLTTHFFQIPVCFHRAFDMARNQDRGA